MSLKSFHIVFVTVCILMFTFLTVWSFVFVPEQSAMIQAVGCVGIAGVVLTLFYGIYFLRKASKMHL